MTPQFRALRRRSPIAAVLLAATVACGRGDGVSATPRGEADRAAAASVALNAEADENLAPYRLAALDLAAAAASAIPVDPHVKSRCRAQASVVDACLRLDRPAQALRIARTIVDWRRPAAVADVAAHLARRGVTETARALVAEAVRDAEAATAVEHAQEWRTDRVRGRIARALLALGEPDRARAYSAAVVAEAEADAALDATTPEQVAADDAALTNAPLDRATDALAACVRTFDRRYADAAVRAAAEARVKDGCGKPPPVLRISALFELAEAAAKHGAKDHARALLDEARRRTDAVPWSPEERVRRLGELARARARTGDPEGARRDAQSAEATFVETRATIASVFRAGVLLPVAEALHAAEDREGALRLYGRALEEAAENPNARPRAEDLVALALSIAVADVEPDAALAARMAEIGAGLKAPW